MMRLEISSNKIEESMNYRIDLALLKIRVIGIGAIAVTFVFAGVSILWYLHMHIHRSLPAFDALLLLMILFGLGMTWIWLNASSLIVINAIEAASRANHKLVYQVLIRTWVPPCPSPRYNNIIKLLRQNCIDPHKEPGLESEFSKYIKKDDFGLYTLTFEGKEIMITKVNSGVFSGRIAKSIMAPKVLSWLLILMVLFKLIPFLINIFKKN